MKRLEGRLRTRRYAEGEVILRAGDPAREMQVIVQGAARVELESGSGRASRRILLGPGQTFGEMSVLSGSPVSATVVAHRETETYALSAEHLSQLLEDEPALYRVFVSLLADRLRHRTRASRPQPAVVVLQLCEDAVSLRPLVHALACGIAHYAPGSIALDACGVPVSDALSRIQRWREDGASEQYLTVTVSAGGLAEIRESLSPGDVVLRVTREANTAAAPWAFGTGHADAQTVLLNDRPSGGSGAWSYAIPDTEVAECRDGSSDWMRSRYPTLDHVVRYVTCREIGVALSIGAAAGFAHLGFLEVLEAAGIPIDFLCGSSMGGVVALGFAQHGKVAPAADAIRRLGVQFAGARGFQLLPRGGLLSRRHIDNVMRQMFGTRTFAELLRPAALVAADLVAGERVIMDTGSIADAARATSAIPGLFPPVRIGARVLVDGGLITRVSADLLARRRCGLRLAAMVRSELPNTELERDAEADRLERRLDRPFGFRAALGASWKLLGWWDSNAQQEKADLVVNIVTPSSDGFNFAAGERMVACGREQTLQRIDSIRKAVDRVLCPGVP